MSSKTITVVTSLLVLGTALLTTMATGAFAKKSGASGCDKPWPYNAGCKGAVAPAEGRKVRLITTNPLSLRKDEPSQPAAPVLVQPPVQPTPPVVAQTDPTEEPQQPTVSRRRANPFLVPVAQPQQPSLEQDTETQPVRRPTPRILERAPVQARGADGEPEQRPERLERFERPARVERRDRPERFEQPERFERPRFDRERPVADERFEPAPQRNAVAPGERPLDDVGPVRRAPVALNDDAPRRERRWCMRGGREFPCPF